MIDLKELIAMDDDSIFNQVDIYLGEMSTVGDEEFLELLDKINACYKELFSRNLSVSNTDRLSEACTKKDAILDKIREKLLKKLDDILAVEEKLNLFNEADKKQYFELQHQWREVSDFQEKINSCEIHLTVQISTIMQEKV